VPMKIDATGGGLQVAISTVRLIEMYRC